jgi:hypothetical protein
MLIIILGRKTKEQVLREHLKIYKEIFVSTERKINLLSQTIQEYTGNNQ